MFSCRRVAPVYLDAVFFAAFRPRFPAAARFAAHRCRIASASRSRPSSVNCTCFFDGLPGPRLALVPGGRPRRFASAVSLIFPRPARAVSIARFCSFEVGNHGMHISKNV